MVPQNLQFGMPQALQPRHPYGSDPQSEHLWREITWTGTILPITWDPLLTSGPGSIHLDLADL